MQNQTDNSEQSRPQKLLSGTSLPETTWIKDDGKKEIYLSRFTRKIKYFDRTTEDISTLIKVLVWWRHYLGIKDEATPAEIEMNVQFLRLEYSDFTIERIQLAVRHSLKGDLKVEVKPYGTFSPLYISSILNAYRVYEDKVISDLLKAKHKKDTAGVEIKTERTPEERLKNRLEYLNHYKDNYASGYLTDFKGIMWATLTGLNFIKDTPECHRYDIKQKVEAYLIKTKNPFEKILTTDQDREMIYRYFIIAEYLDNNKIDFNEHLQYISTSL